MNIHEAAKLAHEKGTGFYRATEDSRVLVIPTNTQGGCLLLTMRYGEESPGVRWEPILDDLVREDWVVEGSEKL